MKLRGISSGKRGVQVAGGFEAAVERLLMFSHSAQPYGRTIMQPRTGA